MVPFQAWDLEAARPSMVAVGTSWHLTSWSNAGRGINWNHWNQLGYDDTTIRQYHCDDMSNVAMVPSCDACGNHGHVKPGNCGTSQSNQRTVAAATAWHWNAKDKIIKITRKQKKKTDPQKGGRTVLHAMLSFKTLMKFERKMNFKKNREVKRCFACPSLASQCICLHGGRCPSPRKQWKSVCKCPTNIRCLGAQSEWWVLLEIEVRLELKKWSVEVIDQVFGLIQHR